MEQAAGYRHTQAHTHRTDELIMQKDGGFYPSGLRELSIISSLSLLEAITIFYTLCICFILGCVKSS